MSWLEVIPLLTIDFRVRDNSWLSSDAHTASSILPALKPADSRSSPVGARICHVRWFRLLDRLRPRPGPAMRGPPCSANGCEGLRGAWLQAGSLLQNPVAASWGVLLYPTTDGSNVHQRSNYFHLHLMAPGPLPSPRSPEGLGGNFWSQKDRLRIAAAQAALCEHGCRQSPAGHGPHPDQFVWLAERCPGLGQLSRRKLSFPGCRQERAQKDTAHPRFQKSRSRKLLVPFHPR